MEQENSCRGAPECHRSGPAILHIPIRIIPVRFQIAPSSGRIPPPISGGTMNRSVAIASILFVGISLAPLGKHVAADEQPLFGYSAESSRTERQWAEKMRAIPSAENLRSYMQHLSARPHNVGTPSDTDNAEWLLATFKHFWLYSHFSPLPVPHPTPHY